MSQAGILKVSSGGLPPTVPTSFTTNNGTATPAANNLNIVGLGELQTFGSGSTISILEQRNAKWIVDPTLNFGTHQTIGAALAAASAGQTIFIRPGTYTENITLKAGVNLTAYVADADPNVIISGTCTASFTGSCSLSGICLQTNSNYFLVVSGANATVVNLLGCNLNASNNTGINFTSSNAGAQINAQNCIGNIATLGTTLFTSSSAGTLNFNYCNLTNSAVSITQSTLTAGNINLNYCYIYFSIFTSNASGINAYYTVFNFLALGINGQILAWGTNPSYITFCHFYNSNNPAGISQAVPLTTLTLENCVFDTTNRIANLSFVGIVNYGNLTFPNGSNGLVALTSSKISTKTQDLCIVKSNIRTGSGSSIFYTDYFCQVNTNLAVTVTLSAQPAQKGETHIIKDYIGLAGTNNITLVDQNGALFDGAASYIINNNYGSVTLIFDGTNWNVV